MSKQPTSNADEPKKELSPEEYKQARLKAKKHLEKEIEYLRVEETYERLQADIEEHKARRLRSIALQYQLMHGTPDMPAQGASAEPQQYNHEKPLEKPFQPQAAPKKETKVRTLAKD